MWSSPLPSLPPLPMPMPVPVRRGAWLPLAIISLGACSAPPGGASANPPPPLGPELVLPVDCVLGQTCEIQNYVDRDPGPGAQDYQCATRSYQGHNGVDFRIPDMAAQRAGVAVLAAAPGRVVRLRDGMADVSVRAVGLAAVDGTECGNGLVIDHGGGWETQYCHLAQGSLKVTEGAQVAAGDPLGQIGLSGQTEYPHLHFTVRKDGVVIDPFTPQAGQDVCEATAPLWAKPLSDQMTYRRGVVLNTGFAAGAVSMDAVEGADIPVAARTAPALVAYVRAIGLEAGDVQHLKVTGPDGALLAESRIAPLEGPKAQYLLYAGRRTPAAGWPPGLYQGQYWVERGGRRALEREFSVQLD